MSAYKNFRQGALLSEPVSFDAEQWARERKQYLAEQEREVTAHAKAYNDLHAGTKGLTGQARMRALAAYRKRLASQVRVIDAEPRAWAAKIISRIADGELMPALVEKMAREAWGVAHEDL
jgi:hypothetical protein